METQKNNTASTNAKGEKTQKKTKNKKKIVVILMWICFLTPILLLVLMLTLTGLGVFGRMPSFEELENPKSNLATEVYADNGDIIGSFFVQNRSYVQYPDLFPEDSAQLITIDGRRVPYIAAALIATEDIRYYTHSGIDFISLARVGVKTIAMQNTSQGGGSTITQQLAKNLFPRNTSKGEGKVVRMARLITSKFKEWITAVKLEYNYTKEEIVAMYLNTVEYGSNAFGVKSAASIFFGKSPEELNIQEAAVLVGVVNAPTRYSPVRNPKNALARRNLVLKRIAEAGGITEAQYDSLSVLPITLNYKPVSHNYGEATYFREMIRLTMTAERPKRRNFYTEWDYEQACKEYDENPIVGWCHKNFKSDGTPYDIYRDGLKIYTTINTAMQNYAEEAMLRQMKNVIQPAMDRQVRRTGVLFKNTPRAKAEKKIMAAIHESDRYYRLKEEGLSEEEILENFKKPCNMKVFTYNGERDTLLSPRDSILHHKRIMRAGFVAIETRTGYVKAYVGGPSFQYFKYDMAKQGKRQVGSTVKPFVYTFALDHLGFTPCTMVPNLPVTIYTGNGQEWTPKEAGNVEYNGNLHPLRWGLTYSRNNYSAWIMKQSRRPEAVADFIHNMGVDSYIAPAYALCLGAFESSVYEMVSAYTTFANEGVHNTPLFVTHIEDRHGNIISSFTTSSREAISKHTAYTMLTMMRNVIVNGTGRRMVWQYGMNGVDVAGKTGTTNENRDAWFICVTPRISAGAWVGGEDNTICLSSQGEGSVVALPIVGDFLRNVHKDPNINISRRDRFVRPSRWRFMSCPDEVGVEEVDEKEKEDKDAPTIAPTQNRTVRGESTNDEFFD